MMKQVRSWSKDKTPNLIASKKVDWSIFEYGSQIPLDFHEDFAVANGNHFLKVNEENFVKLMINENDYEARLVNISRKDFEKGSLQLRYDQNYHLKEILKETFTASYQYFKENRKEKTKKPVHTPDDMAEYIDFYQTDEPYVYKLELRTKRKKSNPKPSFWWVNQGKTYIHEKEGKYLWAPQQSKGGRAIPHHVRLLEPKVGDIVYCYSEKKIRAIGKVEDAAIEAQKPSEITSQDWQEKGYKIELSYYVLEPSIGKDEIPLQWHLDEKGPFNVNGDLNQGYFYPLSEGFAREVFQQFDQRFPTEIRTKMVEMPYQQSDMSIREDSNLNIKETVDHIHNYILSKGFNYEKDEVINLYLSLKTKPFVILSGISGTGKTKMVQWFAESVGATEENGRFFLIPIRPDWNDGSDLLGYVDIKGEFKEGPLTKVIKKAEKNPELPFFVLLDEMNLARVEYYFSDILSVMESRRWKDGKVTSSNLLSKETAGTNIKLSNNLYIIGTVNMDETTHPFSKKVLDRANTIEFNRVDLGNLAFLKESQEMDAIIASHNTFAASYLHLKDVYQTTPNLVERVTNELIQINEVLQKDQAHVGYRVRDEICFYMAYNEQDHLLPFEQALDHAILQKILPRIYGSDSRVDQLLRELYQLFTSKQFEEDEGMTANDLASAKYPRSAAKVIEMLRRLRDGFTSFWIS
ncbi:McrB family protein [Virgibacillus alimentarius]|uniref:McrB family protein n=1 Tax=Virgibacillus alimentarius TaxID=698769 RepID=UPI0004930494|nr:AAA family ATPase [Virgibacillus alimentarius]